MPTEVRDILHDAFKKAMDEPEVLETYKKVELVPAYVGPQELEKMIEDDFNMTKEGLKSLGLIK